MEKVDTHYIFNNHEEILRTLKEENMLDVLWKYYVYRQMSTNYFYVFASLEKANSIITEELGKDFSEIHGEVMPICFDIDIKNPSSFDIELKYKRLDAFLKILSALFDVEISDISVIDRTWMTESEKKISYHVRLNALNIYKYEL